MPKNVIVTIHAMRRTAVLFSCLVLIAADSVSLAQLTAPVSQPHDSSGRAFTERLKSLSSRGGVTAIDCGATSIKPPDDSVSACGQKAFQDHKPFFAGYYSRDGEVVSSAYGLAQDAADNVFAVTYENRGYVAVVPNSHTQVLDDNHTRVTDCIKPVTLEETSQGVLACITPVNLEESAIAAQQKPVETTVCTVLENPPLFNNKMVRIRGEYSENFGYSMLSARGCDRSLWFVPGGDEENLRQGIDVFVATRVGSEDSQGKWILPVPVKQVWDLKFERFQKLKDARNSSDEVSRKENPDESVLHCVAATFIGRIDAVSAAVHEFRKKTSPENRRDGFGFGQMGMFEARLVMQSVEDEAVLGVCGEH